MPDRTIASAISLIKLSLTLQANLFQLFQPIGGVLARPLSSAFALAVPKYAIDVRQKTIRRKQKVFLLFIDSSVLLALVKLKMELWKYSSYR
jgi:hypothetical protein